MTKQKQNGQRVAASKGLAYLAVDMKAAGKRANDFDDALSHHRAGRLQQAEARYRSVLASTPDHAQASFLLGALCLDSQRPDEALTLSLRAAALDPNNAHYHSNCGEALRRLGQFERAAEVCARKCDRRLPWTARASRVTSKQRYAACGSIGAPAWLSRSESQLPRSLRRAAQEPGKHTNWPSPVKSMQSKPA